MSSHYYRNLNRGGHKQLTKVGVPTVSNQRPRLIEELPRRSYCLPQLINKKTKKASEPFDERAEPIHGLPPPPSLAGTWTVRTVRIWLPAADPAVRRRMRQLAARSSCRLSDLATRRRMRPLLPHLEVVDGERAATAARRRRSTPWWSSWI